jgi:uroporphyrinogen-III synthase
VGPVVLTRADGGAFADAVRAAGFDVEQWPAVELIALPVAPEAIADVDVALVISPAAARALAGAPFPPGARFVAQGPGTAAVLREQGRSVALVASPSNRSGLVDAARSLAPNGPWHLFRGDLGAPLDAPDVLVVEHVVYENRPPPDLGRDARPLTAVVYASPSAAHRMLAANPWLSAVPTVVFGATTAAALAGVDRFTPLPEPTPDALVRAILELA